MGQESTPDPSRAPEPPDQFYIDQGWIRRESSWVKQNGDPVYVVDIITAFPPLKAWVMERTKSSWDRCLRKAK